MGSLSLQVTDYAHLYTFKALAAGLLRIQETPILRTDRREIREDSKRRSLGMPDVRQLPAPRNSFHLPDGMSKGTAKWTLWRLHAGTLLCG